MLDDVSFPAALSGRADIDGKLPWLKSNTDRGRGGNDDDDDDDDDRGNNEEGEEFCRGSNNWC